jgi:hypothetical protein
VVRFLAITAAVLLITACGAAGPDSAVRLRRHGITVGPDVGGWRTFTSARGYHFSLPGVPEARSEVREYNVGSIPTTLFDLSRDDDSNVLVLTVFDVRALAHDDAELVYTGLADEARAHGTLRNERDVAISGGVAHDMEFDEPTEGRHSRIRIAWVGGCVARAVAIWDDAFRRPAEETRFFTSFGLGR